jgi:hypothetical protein
MVETAYFGRRCVLVRNGPQEHFNADVRPLSLPAVRPRLPRSVERNEARLFSDDCSDLTAISQKGQLWKGCLGCGA